jgi:hypothetical protein
MTRRSSRFALLGLSLGLTLTAVGGAGCGPVFHREMLGESIAYFSSRAKGAPNEKIWIASIGEQNNCDSGCNFGCKEKGGGAAGGLFSSLSSSKPAGASPYDALAHEVFANYLTQRKKARVIESHRHNYSTELNPETHRKIEFLHDNNKVSTSSCEDLCMLDEAKKRKADKILVYQIIEMKNDELTIHFRLSDVQTGIVEVAQTMKIENMRPIDISYGAPSSGPRRAAPRAAED